MNPNTKEPFDILRTCIFKHGSISRLAAIFCTLFILACLFTAGLWPFNFFPVNKVDLLENGGIHFSAWSQALSSEPIVAAEDDTSLSISLKVRPERYSFRRVSRILSLIDQNARESGFIGQWGPHLIVRNSIQPSRNRPHTEMSVRNALDSEKEVLVTVTSGKDGTIIYLNGAVAERSRSLRMTQRSIGNNRILLGNSPAGNDPWRGTITRLVIQNIYLNEDETKESLISILNDKGQPSKTLLDYRFENDDNSLSDRFGSSNDLLVPARFKPIKARFYEFSADEFRFNRSRISDISLNLIGFIPLGFVLSITLLLILTRTSRWIPIFVLLAGTSVSFIIETGQIFLPSRTSSMSDLFLNCIGTFAGIMIFEASALSFRAGMRYQAALSGSKQGKDGHPSPG